MIFSKPNWVQHKFECGKETKDSSKWGGSTLNIGDVGVSTGLEHRPLTPMGNVQYIPIYSLHFHGVYGLLLYNRLFYLLLIHESRVIDHMTNFLLPDLVIAMIDQ